MTPKEKALELYNTFRNNAPVLEANYRSKRNALIAVDEILNAITTIADKKYDYWKEVKQEIEKL